MIYFAQSRSLLLPVQSRKNSQRKGLEEVGRKKEEVMWEEKKMGSFIPGKFFNREVLYGGECGGPGVKWRR